MIKTWIRTPVDVALQVAGYAMASIAVLQVQPQSKQCGVLLHQCCDLHLDLVAEYLRPLQTIFHSKFQTLFYISVINLRMKFLFSHEMLN